MTKSQSWPESVPADYAGHEKTADAYRRGWNHAHGIACHNVPAIGDSVWTDDLGRVTVDAENVREVHASLCYAAESHARCFSPWEFTAAEFNAAGYDGDGGYRDDGAPYSEELWTAYEAGVADSIAADLATYRDEDYGFDGGGQ